MPYKRRRKRSRRGGKPSISTVKKLIDKEVNKTRETNKMVCYCGWSRLNDILTTNLPSNALTLPEPAEAICCYSLTGGLASTIDFTQNPNSYIAKRLFTLLPVNDQGTNQVGGAQAQQGGTANQMSASGGIDLQLNEAIANVHQLEGRSCFLKKFYASVALNNSSTSVTTPTNMYVRALVIETRRPLSSDQLGKQILLQNHSTLNMSVGSTDTSNYPCSAMGYLNRDVIRKVHYDKVFTLNGGGGATGSMRRFKLKVNINKKARWSYYYPSGVPANTENELTYQGPFMYLVMWAASSSTYQERYALPVAGNEGGGIASARRPAFALSSILTFMDD